MGIVNTEKLLRLRSQEQNDYSKNIAPSRL
jgi:hypothetical protein